MIRFLLNAIRVLFAVFLFIFFIIKMYFIINIKVHENIFPEILGYSYIKVDNDYLSPEINEGDYVFLKYDKNININDYIAFVENEEITLNKVTNINEEEITVGENYLLNINDVKAKLIYNNNKLSKTIRILTNPFSVIIMLLAIIFIPQLTYKRYNE